MTRKENFATNLRYLLGDRSLIRTAKMLGWSETNYEWLRKISTAGIDRVSNKKRADLRRLCELLKLDTPNDLWLDHWAFLLRHRPLDDYHVAVSGSTDAFRLFEFLCDRGGNEDDVLRLMISVWERDNLKEWQQKHYEELLLLLK